MYIYMSEYRAVTSPEVIEALQYMTDSSNSNENLYENIIVYAII